MSRMDNEARLIDICDIPRLGSSLGSADAMATTVGEVTMAFICENDQVPPGMISCDAHSTHSLVSSATLGTTTLAELEGKPFFGALVNIMKAS